MTLSLLNECQLMPGVCLALTHDNCHRHLNIIRDEIRNSSYYQHLQDIKHSFVCKVLFWCLNLLAVCSDCILRTKETKNYIYHLSQEL